MKDTIVKLRILWIWLHGSYETWRSDVWAVDLDSQYCCDGRECGCYGATYREVYTPRPVHPTSGNAP